VVGASSLETVFQETPPALVVEVASPRTRLYDRNRKKDVYQGFGISAYWIVEPDRDRPELTVFELRSGAYEQTAHVTGWPEPTLSHRLYFPLFFGRNGPWFCLPNPRDDRSFGCIRTL
jgi:Uma2 family endonuclease